MCMVVVKRKGKEVDRVGRGISRYGTYLHIRTYLDRFYFYVLEEMI